MKKTLWLVIIGTVLLGLLNVAKAQLPDNTIDYGEGVILDSDLDGLTDEGEKNLYKTNPNIPDTDGDGIYDGAEVLGGSDPLDVNSPQAKERVSETRVVAEQEVPWAWYTARTTGLLGFVLLYISIFSGLAIRTPLLNKLIKPIHSLEIHRHISLQALLFALAHGLSLYFDKYLQFSWLDILVPFATNPEVVSKGVDEQTLAFGIIAFYLMILLVVSSYLKRYIGHKIWRAIHFLNVALYLLVFFHALYLGTDLKSGIGRDIFIYANAGLGALLIANLAFRIWKSIFDRQSLSGSTPTT